MIPMIAGAVIGGVSSIFGARSAAKQARAKTAANRMAAKYKYSATLDSVNLMKAATREQAYNAIQEQVRVGAAEGREVEQEVTKAASTLAAKSEGLTSGRSKGREMVEVMVKGNELKNQMADKTTSAINQISDMRDKRTNDLNNKLLSTYQEMSAVLANEGPDLGNNAAGFLTGAMSGAAAGANLGNALKV